MVKEQQSAKSPTESTASSDQQLTQQTDPQPVPKFPPVPRSPSCLKDATVRGVQTQSTSSEDTPPATDAMVAEGKVIQLDEEVHVSERSTLPTSSSSSPSPPPATVPSEPPRDTGNPPPNAGPTNDPSEENTKIFIGAVVICFMAKLLASVILASCGFYEIGIIIFIVLVLMFLIFWAVAAKSSRSVTLGA